MYNVHCALVIVLLYVVSTTACACCSTTTKTSLPRATWGRGRGGGGWWCVVVVVVVVVVAVVILVVVRRRQAVVVVRSAQARRDHQPAYAANLQGRRGRCAVVIMHHCLNDARRAGGRYQQQPSCIGFVLLAARCLSEENGQQEIRSQQQDQICFEYFI